MGSSVSHLHWIVIAALAGIFYLLFDAARHFAEQLSPVRLRRWTGDTESEGRNNFFQYDPHVFRLLSSAILQLSLVIAYFSTVMIFDEHSLVEGATFALALWFFVVLIWKFALALVPEDTGEWILRGLIPVTQFFYYLFWPLLYPLRRFVESIEHERSSVA